MASTYTLIASTVLTSNAAAVDFNNISQNYTDLVLKTSIRTSVAGLVAVTPSLLLNNSGAGIYNYVYNQTNGTTAVGGNAFANGEAASNNGANDSGSTSNTFSSTEMYFANYSGATGKPFTYYSSTENQATEAYVLAIAQYYNSTSAISSINITIGAGSYNFLAGSTFYLYGVWKGTSTTLPSTPTIGTATDAGTGTSVSVAFTPTSAAGVDASYTALSSPGSITATGTSSPITVSGLTTGTAYTFQVRANNPGGSSAYSSASNSVTPVAPSIYESIATLSASTSTSITFSGIPQTFKHLELRYYDLIGNSSGGAIGLQFNSTTTNYGWYYGYTWGSSGSTFASGAMSGATAMGIMGTHLGTGTAANPDGYFGIININDYTNSTKSKSLIWSAGRLGSGQNTSSLDFGTGNLQPTTSVAAITSLKIVTNGITNFTGTFELYGIKG